MKSGRAETSRSQETLVQDVFRSARALRPPAAVMTRSTGPCEPLV
nr:hypothetical protein [Actinomadura sp. WMMB 499]